MIPKNDFLSTGVATNDSTPATADISKTSNNSGGTPNGNNITVITTQEKKWD